MTISSSSLWFIIAAACLYGINAPFMKMASNHQASTAGMALMYGIGSIILAILTKGSTPFFPTMQGLLWSLPMGIFCGGAFILIGISFKAGASVAIVTTVIAASPLIACIISMTTMGELKQLHLLRFAIGFLLILGGVYLVSTSSKG